MHLDHLWDADSPSAPRLDDLAVAIGSGFLATAVMLSTVHSRADDDLDWSNFSMGILATLGLLGVAVAANFLVTDVDKRATLMAWPGALGAVGAGLMIAVAMDDNDATGYVAALVIVGLSVGGHYLVRRGAFVVAAIAGLLVLYVQLFDDVIGADDVEGDNFAMIVSLAILVFTVLVTAAGWLLPTRDLSGVLVGALAVVGQAITLAALVVVAAFNEAFSDLGEEEERPTRSDTYDNDVWVILLVTALLCVGWAWCTWQSGHVGYRLLLVAALVSTVPLATVALASEHPTWWEVAIGLVGGAVLALVGLRSVSSLRPARPGQRGPGGPSAGLPG